LKNKARSSVIGQKREMKFELKNLRKASLNDLIELGKDSYVIKEEEYEEERADALGKVKNILKE
jgi:hypothetical protein